MNNANVTNLDRNGLRQFGLLLSGFIAVAFGLALPWIWHYPSPSWAWIGAGALATWSVFAPATLRPFYTAWMTMGHLISGIVNCVLLSLVFYLLFLPMGLVLRLGRNDPMSRKFDRNAQSYRVESNRAPKSNMEKPF